LIQRAKVNYLNANTEKLGEGLTRIWF